MKKMNKDYIKKIDIKKDKQDYNSQTRLQNKEKKSNAQMIHISFLGSFMWSDAQTLKRRTNIEASHRHWSDAQTLKRRTVIEAMHRHWSDAQTPDNVFLHTEINFSENDRWATE